MSTFRLSVLVGVLVATVCTVPSGFARPSQKPVQRHRLFIDGGRVPSSFEELWQDSSAVVTGVVETAEAVPEPSAGPPPVPRTRLTIRVLDVFKSDPHASQSGQVIDVLMVGAARDRGDHVDVYEDPDFPALRPSQHSVLFIKWRESAQAFELATETPDSLFYVKDEAVTSSGRSSVAHALASQTYGQLVARLRARGGVK